MQRVELGRVDRQVAGRVDRDVDRGAPAALRDGDGDERLAVRADRDADVVGAVDIGGTEQEVEDGGAAVLRKPAEAEASRNGGRVVRAVNGHRYCLGDE
jgi:hypothetical protein